MKKKVWPALLLCLVLLCCSLLQGCSKDRIVVGKVGEDSITVKEVNIFTDYVLMQYSMTRADIDSADTLKGINESSLNSLVIYKLMMLKAEEKGMYPFSPSNQKHVDDLVQKNLANVTQFGMTQDDLKQLLTWLEAYQLVMADATKSVTVTDADIQAEYDKQVAAEKASYDADASAYEDAKGDGSTVIVYKPAGYRYIKHILIKIPDDTVSQISTARSGGDDKTADSLRDAGLKLLKAKADDVLSQVQNGGDFDALMAKYGEDQGMQAEPASKTGYEVGSATNFVKEFKDAAMALAKVGDFTGLVATDYGYHIIKWVSIAPSGSLNLADVKDALKASVLQTKQDDAWNAIIEKWKSEIKIEQHPEKIPAPVIKPAATTKK
jgi:parvulin-like peptidyl-prolyl isomerase